MAVVTSASERIEPPRNHPALSAVYSGDGSSTGSMWTIGPTRGPIHEENFMPTRRKLTCALALSAALAALLAIAPGLTLAHTNGPPPPPPPPPPFMGSPILHHVLGALHSIQISDEEKTQIHALMDQYHQAAGPRQERLQAAHKAFADQALAESYDEVALRSAAAVFAGLQAEELVSAAGLLKDIRSVLTPEERDQLQKALAKMPEGGEMHGPWHMHGPHDAGPGGASAPQD
jgi:Spy/CpxP family protein refolding chaperone